MRGRRSPWQWHSGPSALRTGRTAVAACPVCSNDRLEKRTAPEWSTGMALPNERSHHTVWVDLPGGRTRAQRYVADGDRLICLGDDGLAGVTDGTGLFASLRGLACGPLERYFRVGDT